MQPPKPRTRWTLAIVSLALFMVVLDNLIVTVALPSIQRDLGATLQQLEWTVNAYTLAFAVTLIPGAALGDRFGRKRDLPRRARALHRLLRRRGPRARRLGARRRPRPAGHRRRDRRPAHPDPARRGVPARAARRRAGHLVGHQRPGHRPRPARRRRGRLRPLVAVDLLDQRPARRRPAPARRGLPARESRRGDPPRPARRRPRHDGLFALVFGLVRGQGEGWTSPLIVGSLSAGAVLLAAVRRP